MVRLYGCCGLAASVLSSEPWRSRLSAYFGIATGLLAISILIAAIELAVRGQTTRSTKCSAGITFLAALILLLLGLQNGILESYVRWLQKPSMAELFPWTASSPTADAAKSAAPAEPAAPIVAPVAKTLGGDLQVSVTSATLMPVPAPSRSSSRAVPPSHRVVVLALRLENLSKARKMDYHPWSSDPVDPAKDRVVLSDNHGNRYECARHAHKEVTAEAASLPPGQSATDTLTFQPLTAPAERFELSLPNRNFGQDGALTIQIPKGMIVLEPDDFPAADEVAPPLPAIAGASQPSAASEPVAPPPAVPEVAQAPATRPAAHPLPSGGDIHSVGRTFGLGSWQYRVSACQWKDTFFNPAGRTIRPAAGHAFLTVMLTARNVSPSTSLLPQVQLAGDDGLCYDPCYKSEGEADGLPVGSQEFISREFTFQAPAGKAYSLILLDGWLATKTAAVRIEPGRSAAQQDDGGQNSAGE